MGTPDDFDAMEEMVIDATQNGTDDIVLALIIEVTREVLKTGRPLMQDLMDEPIFWRRFIVRWVRMAIDEQSAMNEALEGALDDINNRLTAG